MAENRVLNTRDRQQPITIVSGLPRSGTSLMMRMLQAGGMPVLVDGAREADADNPRGYYEFGPVKRTRVDTTWVDLAHGKAVKVVYSLLYALSPAHEYRVLMMRRKLSEVVASQNLMLQRIGQYTDNATGEQRLIETLAAETSKVLQWLSEQPNISMMEVDYNQLLLNPHAAITTIADFLGESLDVDAMSFCIEPALYRQRK